MVEGGETPQEGADESRGASSLIECGISDHILIFAYEANIRNGSFTAIRLQVRSNVREGWFPVVALLARWKRSEAVGASIFPTSARVQTSINGGKLAQRPADPATNERGHHRRQRNSFRHLASVGGSARCRKWVVRGSSSPS